MKRKLLYLTILILIFLIFKNYTTVLESTTLAVELWIYKVFPYLFIMIALNDILINSNFISLFKNTSLYIFIASLLSGTPTSAYIIGNLYKQGNISKNNAHCYSHNPKGRADTKSANSQHGHHKSKF